MAGVKHTGGPDLRDLRARLARISSPAFRQTMARNLGEEARTQVAQGFREERDPYGKPWAPLKARRGRILQDTGRMRASCAVQATADGFRIDIPVVYSRPHQYGARIAPHSRIRARENYHDPRTGRLVSKRTKLKTVYVSTIKRQTFANGIAIPQRQMIPMAQTGGLGPIWSAALNKAATALLDKSLKGAA